MKRIGFIGCGRLCKSLAITMDKKGYAISALYSRTKEHALDLASKLSNCKVYNDAQSLVNDVDVVFFTTNDTVMKSIVDTLTFKENQFVCHCSGASKLDVISKAYKYKALIGKFHPILSITDRYVDFSETTFGLNGDEEVVEYFKQIVRDLNGYSVMVDDSICALYHASTCLTSNYAVALLNESCELWGQMGLTKEAGEKALVKLLESTVENLKNNGLNRSLSGPISRNDQKSISDHIEGFKQIASDKLGLYEYMGKITVDYALNSGYINPEQAQGLKNRFDEKEA